MSDTNNPMAMDAQYCPTCGACPSDQVKDWRGKPSPMLVLQKVAAGEAMKRAQAIIDRARRAIDARMNDGMPEAAAAQAAEVIWDNPITPAHWGEPPAGDMHAAWVLDRIAGRDGLHDHDRMFLRELATIVRGM